MFNWLKQLFNREPEIFTGVLYEESKFDELPQIGEIVATIAPVEWKEIDTSKLPSYPMYSQDGSGTCVAMSLSLIATILYKQRTGEDIKFSPAYLYKQRVNSGAGMMIPNVFDIAGKGMLPMQFMPCEDMSEGAVNDLIVEEWFKNVADGLALEDKFVNLGTGDFDTVVSTLQATGKPLMAWFKFNYDEWTSIPLIKTTQPKLHHSVTILPNGFGTIKGKKYLIIQDSWGLSSTQYKGLRLISEDFFRQRNTFCGYPRRFKFQEGGDKPIYDSKSIISLQKCLKYLGYFPLKVDFVESFGPLTKEALKKFQKANGILNTGVLDEQTKLLLINQFN